MASVFLASVTAVDLTQYTCIRRVYELSNAVEKHLTCIMEQLIFFYGDSKWLSCKTHVHIMYKSLYNTVYLIEVHLT